MCHIFLEFTSGVTPANLFHIPVSKHLGGGTGIYRAAMASHFETRQTLYRLSYAGSAGRGRKLNQSNCNSK